MKTKATIMFILSFFISSFYLCQGMDDMNTSDNSMTTVINNNMMRARNWMHNVYMTYQEFGIIATITSLFNWYDFKRITGLDKSKLLNSTSEQLDVATARINKMMKYKGISPKLVQFLNDIDDARVKKEEGETDPNKIYTPELGAQYTEEALQEQKKQKTQR